MVAPIDRPEARLAIPSPVPCQEISKSTIYTMIPSAVRSRIPVLTSLRHTAKTIVLHGSISRRKGYSVSRSDSGKEKDSDSWTSTTESSGASTPTIRPDSPEETVSSYELITRVLPSTETRSGVDWEVACIGVKLWVTAKTQAEQGGDPVALRSMHIDALRYMHMALPSDLTAVEVQSLRASMSPQLFSQLMSSREEVTRREPSLLRQSVAQFVCWLLTGLLLVLPIMMTLLNRLLQYERQHQVTERVIANSLELTSSLGERGFELHRAVLRFKDGRVGGACLDAGAWFIKGIVGGVNDGIDAVAQSRASPKTS